MSAVVPARSRSGRVILGILALIAAVNLILAVIERATGGAPGGPPSSSYGTAPQGLAAYASLLEEEGHPVSRLRQPASEVRLDPGLTLVVLDAVVPDDDARAISAFVANGGRLIAGGHEPGWLRRVVDDPPRWAPQFIGEAARLAPVPEVVGVEHVVSGEPSAWVSPGPALPVLGDGTRSLLAVRSVSRGRIAFLASASPLQNGLISRADNAALGLALAGEPGRRVVFAEEVHGFRNQAGAAAIPSRIRWTLAGLAVAALVWTIGRARRFGPTEAASRELGPPRALFVDSLAQTLARTKRRDEAVAGLRAEIASRIARVTGVDTRSDDALRGAAGRMGLDAHEVAVLTSEARTDEDVVTLGRVFTKVSSN